ncbi:MAG: hypothetical protein RR308_09215, partial [Hafnia sp.]
DASRQLLPLLGRQHMGQHLVIVTQGDVMGTVGSTNTSRILRVE